MLQDHTLSIFSKLFPTNEGRSLIYGRRFACAAAGRDASLCLSVTTRVGSEVLHVLALSEPM